MRIKKRVYAITIIFILSVLLCACTPGQNEVSADGVSGQELNEYLIANSIELTCTMADLAQSAEYRAWFSGEPELQETVTGIGAGEYISPDKAVLIKVPDSTADAVINDVMGELNLSEAAYETVVTKMLLSVPSMLNARQGVLEITVANMLMADKVIGQHQDFAANTYVVLMYGNHSSVTLFRNSAAGVISASASFLFPGDDLMKAVTEETISDYFSQMFHNSEFSVEYIAGDRIASY